MPGYYKIIMKLLCLIVNIALAILKASDPVAYSLFAEQAKALDVHINKISFL